jgi:2-polyprenyl-3-methyl-5-hydroxy-6-metoxy-1,4-benzoquinol methylase
MRFVVADAHDVVLADTFDAIILSDLVNDVWDIQRILERIPTFATPRTRIILNTYSRAWEPILAAAQHSA